ncbi:SLC35G2 [Branchiostoma lanceolatum]|uniref:SLC35G2 protein n=1 Tax=Branchiostoma lanceolatum TaxID=7740 RepID=A0A8J9YRW2_BRALA|nr:SLC35G2 [Branchiostoma lanceolatum]
MRPGPCDQWGVAACLASGLFIGFVPATSRYVQDRGYTPYQMFLFNDSLILLAVLFVGVFNKTNLWPTSLKQAFWLICQGICRYVSITCQFISYRKIPPANAETIWSACMPVFVFTLSCVFLHEIPTCVTNLGSLWCTAGVVLLGYSDFVNRWPSTDAADAGIGVALAVTAALTYAMLSVNAKSLLGYTSRTMVMTYTYGITTVTAGITAGLTSTVWRLEPETAGVLAVSCISYALGVLFFYLGLKLVEVNAVTALVQLNAFSAYGLQWAMLGFAPTVLDGLGLACVLVGTSSVAMWEALARWKDERHVVFMKRLNFFKSTVK